MSVNNISNTITPIENLLIVIPITPSNKTTSGYKPGKNDYMHICRYGSLRLANGVIIGYVHCFEADSSTWTTQEPCALS